MVVERLGCFPVPAYPASWYWSRLVRKSKIFETIDIDMVYQVLSESSTHRSSTQLTLTKPVSKGKENFAIFRWLTWIIPLASFRSPIIEENR